MSLLPWDDIFADQLATDIIVEQRQYGLQEFVPHARWQLGGRPYAALVVAEDSYDGLAWVDESGNPQAIEIIMIDDKVLDATGLTFTALKKRRYE